MENPLHCYLSFGIIVLELKGLIVEGSLTMPFEAVFKQALTVGGQWKRQELTNSDTIGTLPGGSWDGKGYSDPKVENKNWALFFEDNISIWMNEFMRV